MLLMTSMAGSLTTVFWILMRRFLEKRTDVRDMYRLVRVVTFAYIFPFFYFLVDFIMRIQQRKHTLLLHLPPFLNNACVVLFFIWIGVMLLLFLRRLDLKGHFRVVARGRIQPEVQCERVLRQVCKELKIQKKVRLYRGYAVASPFIKGIFHPAIYLPVDDLRDARELEMVFHHELSHWKQKDTLWKPIIAFINIIYWFNPLSAYLWRQISLWAEASCDANCYEGNFGQKEYFSLLYKMQESFQSRKMDFIPMWSEGKNQLLWRINHMNTGKANKISRITVAMIAAGCMVFGGTVTCAAADGMHQICEQAYWRTAESVETEQQDLPEERPIQYGTREELEEDTQIVEMGEMEIMPYSGDFIDWTVSRGTTDLSGGFSLNSGNNVKIMLTISKKSSNIRVGLMEPGNTTQYITGGGDVFQTFTARKSGTHCIFVYNHTSTKIRVQGSYVY